MNDNIDLHSAILPPLPHRSARVSRACTSTRPSPTVRLDIRPRARPPVARRRDPLPISIHVAPPILALGLPAITRNPQ
jgi:hypothetical protein